jgi:hypothetical protein
MTNSGGVHLCRSCGVPGYENYCSRCGQPYVVKRITLQSLLHDAWHLFTHLDKGFGFTLKSLITQPGHMQRSYLEGDRARHQKPFSMFFICATIAAIGRYWMYLLLQRYYQAGDLQEAQFFHQYMVMLHIALLPLYTLITYLFFRKAGYNYGELGVLMLYTVSFFFLAVTLISLLKFIWPHMDTAYVELPLLLVYNAVTFVNFFKAQPRTATVLKSVAAMCITFLLVHYIEKLLIQMMQ